MRKKVSAICPQRADDSSARQKQFVRASRTSRPRIENSLSASRGQAETFKGVGRNRYNVVAGNRLLLFLFLFFSFLFGLGSWLVAFVQTVDDILCDVEFLVGHKDIVACLRQNHVELLVLVVGL